VQTQKANGEKTNEARAKRGNSGKNKQKSFDSTLLELASSNHKKMTSCGDRENE